jgi:hypothetical protein
MHATRLSGTRRQAPITSGDSEDGPNREGKILRFRDLLVGGRARAALLEAGLFEEKVFLPVRVVDQPEPGVQVLDDDNRPLKPMYTPAELERLRQQEAELGLGTRPTP